MKRTFIIAIMMLAAAAGFAQGPPGPPPVDEEKIEALRIAFLTRYLDLSAEEAQKFWPVYNQYHKELTELFELRREARKNDDNSLDEDLEYDIKIVAVRKKYRNEFLKVLSPEKTSHFYQAEREFREELIKQLKNRRQ
ncbi:MAG: periplasmic heavy metal sensor [Sphingobacteriales bacterium]|nr:MAG: periplasmic heavy metal sensor [Sphingobacteriales bacterium]